MAAGSAGAGSRAAGAWARALCLLAVAGAWWVTCWRLVALPEPLLVTNLLVDDALYFAQPARNLVAGNGYSFDGVELTNGVQTLWAAVCVGLAWLCAEGATMLRAMIAASALAWFAAACGVFVWLRRLSWPAALFAASGFLWSGVQQRVALQGMENGLHALVSVCVLFAGARAVEARWSDRSALLLGVALAFFGLSRTEAVMLGPLVALPVLAGRLGAPDALVRRARAVVLLAIPGVVLVGGAMLASKLVFDCWLPISGSVKQLYEQDWGRWQGRGGVLACVGWHLEFVFELAFAPLRDHVPDLLAAGTGLRYRVFRNVTWALLAVGVVAALRRRPRGARPFAWLFGAYALLHLALMGLTLPHFTNYATWYFASEAVAVWIGLGVVACAARGRWRCVPIGLALLMAPAGARVAGELGADVRTNVFREAGLWLRQNAAPGAVIGALSSGWVAWYADAQHVVNLDGLINNRRYLDDFLARGRVGDYFDDRGITWFADYQSCDAWRTGISWRGNVPPRRLVPRRYWRMANREAYVAWQVLDERAGFELLGDGGPAVRDRYVELAVAADVHARFDVVDEAGVAADGAAARVVARSLVVLPDLELRHVVATRAQLDAIALTADTVHPDHDLRVAAADGVHLLGYDLTRSEQRTAVTLFWSCDAPPSAQPAVWLEDDAGGRVAVGSCRGTLPMTAWPAGRVVVETYVLPGAGAKLVVGDDAFTLAAAQ